MCPSAFYVDYTQDYLAGEVVTLPRRYTPFIVADKHVCSSKKTQLIHFLLTCTINNSLVVFPRASTIKRGRNITRHSAIIFLSSLIE